jgi:hypothetical protein
VEASGDGLAFALESGRDFDIAVEQVVRYDSVELEADSLAVSVTSTNTPPALACPRV